MKGETRPGPFSSSTECWFSSVWTPPIPVGVDGAAPLRDDLGVAGVLPRQLRGRDGVMGEGVGAPRLLRVEEVDGIEVVHLAGDAHGQVGVVERA